ncbi:MAG: hypothetical protein KZQ83_14195 [gamma proteobacterium symbiont of Taylorina sp.]|nr:hypothetical protein [gamma proteobacterium symbiont of Taylorina sp.]
MNHIIIGYAVLCLFIPWQAYAGDKEPDGKLLFENHGCTNCHGLNGVHPTSKYAPVLKGKPADYLIKKASAIFSGKRFSNNTRLMHEQFCIGDEKDEGCYPTPSNSELKKIAQWLSLGLAEKKKTPQALYVSAQGAYDKLQELDDKTLFIDIRTRAEVAFLGMPNDIDANIPYMTIGDYSEWNEKKQNFKLYPNSEFTLLIDEFVSKHGFDKDSPIILICRSGNRSAKAAKLLFATGYTNVYSVVDGFEGDKLKEGTRKGERIVNGWKNSGLPWSYKLKREAMYMEI